MLIICNKNEIYEAVINVSKAVSDKSTIQALEGIKFKLNGNILELTGYDLELGIRIELMVKSEDSGEVIINARLFADIIKRMPCDEILIEINENLQVRIKGGNTEYTISAQPSDEYPQLPEAEDGESFKVSQPVLKNMINQTIFSVSQDDFKPVFKGELFEIKDGTFNMVALNRYRMAVRTEAIKSEKEMKFVVPGKALSEISKLLKDDDDLMCEIKTSESGKHIIFEISGYYVFSRLLEGEFLNYRSSLPKEAVTEVIVDTKQLINCLERASLLITERIKSPVRCKFDNGQLKVSCNTAIGKIYDEIDVDISGPMIEIGFNCKYFIEPLKTISDDKVKLHLNGGQVGMKITAVNDDKYVFLVLPIKLGSE